MLMMTTGYLIEYQERTSFFFKKEPGDNFTEKRKALVSRATLAQILGMHKYLVFTAYLMDIDQYKHNMPEIEIITVGE